MTELYGFVVIGVALPLAFVTYCSLLHWIGTYRSTISPIRLDGSELLFASHVQWETPPGMVMLPMTGATLTPSGMVMLLRPRVNVTTLTDGKDTIKCRDILS